MKKTPTPDTRLNRQQALILVAFGSFIGGALLTGAILTFSQHAPKVTALRESSLSKDGTGYTFIDPLIGIKGVDDIGRYKDIKDELTNYIADQKKNGLVRASINFRDINEPGGFVINPTEQYTPASLNKVPLMMTYYRISETNPAILSQKIVYTGKKDTNSVEEIKSAVQLTPGTQYTVQELIEHMIRYSDNNAVALLAQNLTDTRNTNVYLSVFTDLGLDSNLAVQYQDSITVSQYSIFLRALYNSTYLDRTNSERALELLSETDFTAGIESGVPNNVLVTQKFGEMRITDANDVVTGKEVHNCGIVYYPGHPYLLCIMTEGKGDNVKALEGNIADISRIVYKHMQQLNP